MTLKTVTFLKQFRENNLFNLFLKNEHLDEEFEDMDNYIQTNNDMLDFLYDITYNPSLYLSESITKYFELHYNEPAEYLTSELLMLLYYMADTNDADTSNLSKELKDNVQETINIFKYILQLKEEDTLKEDILNQNIELFNELLNKTLPMVCNHMNSVAETFDKSNMYQQMINNFGNINNNFDKFIDSVLPTDEEKDNFLNLIKKLTNENKTNENNEITDDIINIEALNEYNKISSENI